MSDAKTPERQLVVPHSVPPGSRAAVVEAELAEARSRIALLESQLAAAQTVIGAAQRFIDTGGFVAESARQIKTHNDLRITLLNAARVSGEASNGVD